ncbi:putative methyltransferase-domain-containing protein [Mucidula mucida]|nr:putative methyltransferase-domain-containing protein [Mucidula mucida]
MDNAESSVRSFGAIRLREDALRVLDADEEVILLYSDRDVETSTDNFRGLGHVDSQQNVLAIDIELTPTRFTNTGSSHRGRSARKHIKTAKPQGKTISLQIAQDVTALRSRAGDTGSIVWKASVDFARLVLQQINYGLSEESLLVKERLDELTVLELGAGTGILALLLHSCFKKYIATDTAAMLHLLNKNLAQTDNVSVSELDWVTLLSTPPRLRPRAYDFPTLDLIFAVDCVYNPSLMPAFVETIDYLCAVDLTTVIVVIELRDEGAVTAMFELWLAQGNWEIWRVGRSNGLGKPYAVWIARKTKNMDT